MGARPSHDGGAAVRGQRDGHALIGAFKSVGAAQLGLLLQDPRWPKSISTDRNTSSVLSLGGCVCIRVAGRNGLRRQIPPVSLVVGLFFVTVPKTNQHEKNKTRHREDDRRQQNTFYNSSHWCNPQPIVERRDLLVFCVDCAIAANGVAINSDSGRNVRSPVGIGNRARSG